MTDAKDVIMRILYSFPHALGAPGIGTTAVNQVLSLLDRNHQVTVFAASIHQNTPIPRATIVTTMMFGGVRVPHKVLGMDRTMALHDRRAAAYLRRHADKFDVVHCWPGASLDTPIAAADLRIPAVREVPNTHTANAYEVVARLCSDLGIELPKGHSHRTNISRLKREEAEYEASYRLLVPSAYVRSSFLERGFSPEKLLQHQYGFDPASFKPREGPRSGPFHAVFLGAVEPRKGLHIALEAWRRAGAHERARFSIYGRVVEEYRPAIEEYLQMPNVQLHEFTDDAASVLREADALVLPSFEEGSALVTYEAQGCGAIPVVSDAAGAQCEHLVTGMVHPAGDVDMLAQHFSRLIDEPALLANLRTAVLQQRDKLTWAAAAARLDGCYEAARASLA
ncbi:MAG: glycosyltransferase family 4 protein [Phenylobacterium sp.]